MWDHQHPRERERRASNVRRREAPEAPRDRAALIGAAAAHGNAAVARLLARRQPEGGQSRPALASEPVEPTAAPPWLGQIYVHAGLVPAADVPDLISAAGVFAVMRAMRCTETASSAPDAERVSLKGKGRAHALDWESKHPKIAQDKPLRATFHANRATQLQGTFGVWSVDMVASAIEVAEAAGRPDVASALEDGLFRATQHALVETLNVTASERYLKASGKTYCNIYAHDLVTAMGGYLPRVWWTDAAWARIQDGAEIVPLARYREMKKAKEPLDDVVVAEYGKTVGELNANALNRWMRGPGSESFGWQEETDMDAAQAAANGGQIVVLLAANKSSKRSGHITVILAESPEHQAKRGDDGKVVVPLQSQAGSKNFKYSAESGAPGSKSREWWKDKSHKEGAAWIFTGQMQGGVATPEEMGAEIPEE